jgi:hypothetical protein
MREQTREKAIMILIGFMLMFSCKIATAQHLWDYLPPKGYVAFKAEQPLVIDGKPDKAWDNAPWSDYFIDIEGDKNPKPRFKTRMKMLWDDKFLYVYAEMEEPNVVGEQTIRDATIYLENDFEMFIKPSEPTPHYGEFEVNALGTFWDLFFMRPYRSGPNLTNSWDMRDIKIGVDIKGTINNPNDKDEGWNVEIAFPWKALNDLGNKGYFVDGMIWRVNFSRVQYGEKQDNWTWTHQRVINMHEPEHWGYVQLSDKPRGTVEFKRPEEEPIMSTLFYLFRAKKENMEAKSIKELIGDDTIKVKGITMKAELQHYLYGFHIILTNVENGKKYVIDEREQILEI